MDNQFEISQDGKTLKKVLDMSLTHLSIPDDIVEIKYNAFNNCTNLQSVELNKNIKKIPSFLGCISLHTIMVSGDNDLFVSLDGIVYSKDRTKIVKCPIAKQISKFVIPNTVKTVGYGAFRDCVNIQCVDLPCGVETIERRSFSGCTSLKAITIPESVKTIEYHAFAETAIKTVNIPKSVCHLEESAFDDCTSLSAINVDVDNDIYSSVDGIVYLKNLEEIVLVPRGKVMESFVIPDTVKIIRYGAFNECSFIRSIKVPGSIEEIGGNSFDGLFDGLLALKDVVISDGVKIIRWGAFCNCPSLTNVDIPKSVIEIEQAFDNCTSLKSISVAEENCHYASVEGVLYTKDLSKIVTFPEGKNVEHFVVPESVMEIEDWAFSGQSFLRSVDIPSNVTKIGRFAFSNCKVLQRIILPKLLVKIEEGLFEGCSSLAEINVPVGVMEIGKDAFKDTIWLNENKTDKHGFVIINNILIKYDKELDNNYISIPHGIRVIGEAVFEDCKSLVSVDIPNTVQIIGKEAFKGCGSLKTLDIPYSVTEICDYAFGYCLSLDDVDIPNSVLKIGSHTFCGCKSLKTIKLPAKLKSIEDATFYGCSSLENVTIPDGVIEIVGGHWGAFDSCTSLKSIEVPDSVTNIGYKAFHNSGIENITISSSIEWIGDHSLCNCPLSHIEVKDGNLAYVSKEGVLYSYYELSYHDGSLYYTKWGKNDGRKSLIKYPPKKTSKSFVLDKDVLVLMSCAFKRAEDLQEIILHDNVNCIGDQQTFAHCISLKNIIIPPQIKTIPRMAFEGCSNLEEVVLPKSKDLHILKDAFKGCVKLKNIHAIAENIENVVIDDAFDEETYNNCILFIPSGTRWAYRHHPIFSKFKRIEIER